MEQVEASLQAILGGTEPSRLEGDKLDFKRSGGGDQYRRLARAAACFANASGGTIVVGVHDKRVGKAALVGTALDPAQVRAQIYTLTQPGLVVSCEELRYDVEAAAGHGRRVWARAALPNPGQRMNRIHNT